MTRPHLSIRLRSGAERDAIDAAAKATDEPPSRWARRILLEAAGAPTDEPPAAEAARRMRRGERDPWRVLPGEEHGGDDG